MLQIFQTWLPSIRYLCSYLVTEIIGLIFRNDKHSHFQLISHLWKLGHYVSKFDPRFENSGFISETKNVVTTKYWHNYLTLNMARLERENIFIGQWYLVLQKLRDNCIKNTQSSIWIWYLDWFQLLLWKKLIETTPTPTENKAHIYKLSGLTQNIWPY